MSSAQDAVWITEADVVALVALSDAIPALEKGLAQEHSGRASNMAKTHAVWNNNRSTLHAIGAVMEGDAVVGTKTWAHTPGGACPLLILYSADNGQLVAVIEAFALGQLRTAGISGVATRWMAAAEADDMALIGTGKQALAQVAGVHAVRPLKRLRVYSPNPDNRAAFIAKARKQFTFSIEESASVQDAVSDASIVTLVTRAREPFLESAMLARGCHINAVGAITPERQEFTQDIFARAGLIAVDSVDSVRRLSSEFIEQFNPAPAHWDAVRPLSERVAQAEPRRREVDLSLFKAMGMGLSDLSLGVEILARARANGVGRPLPVPVKTPARLT